MKLDFQPFKPHPLLLGGHLQTIIPRLVGTPPRMANAKLYPVVFPDGDESYFRVDEPEDCSEDTPILALFHGLGGCSESPYMLRIGDRGTKQGLRVARFSHRGCGPENFIKAKGIYHSGSKDDIRHGLKTLAEQFPSAPIAVIGFSLSGTMVLNMVGHYSDIQAQIPQLQFAASICSPVNLVSSSRRLTQIDNIIYDQYFTFYLRKHIERRAAEFGLPRTQFSRKFVTLHLFDNEFTAPLAGFDNAQQYYEQCSPKLVLDRIKIPTLILASEDDPVANVEDLKQAKLSGSAKISLHKTGGHMGFLAREKTRYGDRRWLESELVSWANYNLQKR